MVEKFSYNIKLPFECPKNIKLRGKNEITYI